MYDAGDTFDRKPIRLSLQAARQHLNNFSTKWVNKTRKRVKKIYKTMLKKIADSYEKRRVGRVEPRVRKRRPKAYPLMQETKDCPRELQSLDPVVEQFLRHQERQFPDSL